MNNFPLQNRAVIGNDDKLDLLSKLALAKDRIERTMLDKEFSDLFKHFNVFFVTINPRIDASKWNKDIDKLRKKLHKTSVCRSFHNFEFSTRSELHKYRLHSHSLIFLHKQTCKRNKKWFLTTNGFMMKICGDKQKIDVKIVKTHKDLIHRIRYIMGYKKEDKLADVKEDQRIRRECFKPPLKDYYYRSGDNPSYHQQTMNSRYIAQLDAYMLARIADTRQVVPVNFA